MHSMQSVQAAAALAVRANGLAAASDTRWQGSWISVHPPALGLPHSRLVLRLAAIRQHAQECMPATTTPSLHRCRDLVERVLGRLPLTQITLCGSMLEVSAGCTYVWRGGYCSQEERSVTPTQLLLAQGCCAAGGGLQACQLDMRIT